MRFSMRTYFMEQGSVFHHWMAKKTWLKQFSCAPKFHTVRAKYQLLLTCFFRTFYVWYCLFTTVQCRPADALPWWTWHRGHSGTRPPGTVGSTSSPRGARGPRSVSGIGFNSKICVWFMPWNCQHWENVKKPQVKTWLWKKNEAVKHKTFPIEENLLSHYVLKTYPSISQWHQFAECFRHNCLIESHSVLFYKSK